MWSLYAQLARVISGAAFVLILTRTLSPDLLGIWYLFLSIFGVAMLFEGGLCQVMGRHAAYLAADVESGRLGSERITAFVRSGSRFYWGLSVVISTGAFLVGSWWLKRSVPTFSQTTGTLLAWALYAVHGLIVIPNSFYGATIGGLGQLWRSQRTAVVSAAANALLLTAAFAFPNSLLIPASALLVSQLIAGILHRATLRQLAPRPTLCPPATTGALPVNPWRRIAADGGKMLMIMLSAQLLTNILVLVLARHLPLSTIASYGLTTQLAWIVMAFSSVWSQSVFYELANLRQKGDLGQMRRTFLETVPKAVGSCFLGMVAIALVVPPLLNLAQAKSHLLPPLTLVAVLGCLWVEFTITQFSQMLMSQNNMNVAYYSLAAAFLICIGTMVLLSMGYSLIVVFALRFLLYASIVGIPVVAMSLRALSHSPRTHPDSVPIQ